jgi:hypothetical protein
MADPVNFSAWTDDEVILVLSGRLDEGGIRSSILGYNAGFKRGEAVGRNQMRAEFAGFVSKMSTPESV